jgi:hypothetical protein
MAAEFTPLPPKFEKSLQHALICSVLLSGSAATQSAKARVMACGFAQAWVLIARATVNGFETNGAANQMAMNTG